MIISVRMNYILKFNLFTISRVQLEQVPYRDVRSLTISKAPVLITAEQMW